MSSFKDNSTKTGRFLAVALIALIVFAGLSDPRLRHSKPDPKRIKVQEEAEKRLAAVKKKVALKQAKEAAAPSPAAASIGGTISKTDLDLLSERYGRENPFEPFIETPSSAELTGDGVKLPPVGPLPPMILENPRNMTLSATSVSGKNAFAVVNGEILRIGDFFQGYKVSYISYDQVKMVNEFKDQVLLSIKQEGVNNFLSDKGYISNLADDISSKSKLVPEGTNEAAPFKDMQTKQSGVPPVPFVPGARQPAPAKTPQKKSEAPPNTANQKDSKPAASENKPAATANTRPSQLDAIKKILTDPRNVIKK